MKPKLVGADRLEDGLVITFSDGKQAFYPAAFLYEGLSRLEQFTVEARWRDLEDTLDRSE